MSKPLRSQSDLSTGRRFFAPARVNLLGEHTDYTGGFVLPMAINFSTVATLVPLDEPRYRFSSEQFPERIELSAEDRSGASGNWSDYPVGVLRALEERGIVPPGFDLHIGGDVPLATGLSSSASVEVASAMAMLAHARVELPVEQIALLCQRAENGFVNSPCGIMDQFAVVAAQAHNLLLLDTRSLAYELIPMAEDTRVVVCNSMVSHSIASGEYGVRRREVEAGQQVLLAAFPRIGSLRDVTIEELNACRGQMLPESFLRCRHIITENLRVLEAKDAMRRSDYPAFGRLMLEGHASLRDDFAASCPEIDFLVEMAVALEGCFGARMTGGGFGGCTVNLVAREKAESFAQELGQSYRQRFGMAPETYICEAVDGAMRRNHAGVRP